MSKQLDEAPTNGNLESSVAIERYEELKNQARKLMADKASHDLTIQMNDFFEVIKHGDEAHQAWLKGAIEGFFRVRLTAN